MLAKEVNDYEKSTIQYFDDIKKIEPLSRDEERELFNLYQETHDERIRNKILTSNLKFVINVAKQFKNRGIPFADLVAEGNLGLTRAFDKFDNSRDTKFITYAVWWIKQAILEALTKRNGLPAEDLPTEYENISPELDENVSKPTNDTTFEDNEGKYDPEREIEIQECLNTLMADLNDREKDILIQKYGLDGNKPKTLEEIGETYGLTKERIRQINEKTYKKLRSKALLNQITSAIVLVEN